MMQHFSCFVVYPILTDECVFMAATLDLMTTEGLNDGKQNSLLQNSLFCLD